VDNTIVQYNNTNIVNIEAQNKNNCYWILNYSVSTIKKLKNKRGYDTSSLWFISKEVYGAKAKYKKRKILCTYHMKD